MNTETEKKIRIAESNLSRQLDWVGRYDTRIAFVSGVAIAMLGVLANASTSIKCWTIQEYITFGLSGALLLISLVYVYFGQHPKILAPNQSLIFFGTIARMSESEFKTKFHSETDASYLDDLLSQTHVNAVIIRGKFSNLKVALSLIVFSVVPWIIAIYLSRIFIK